MELEWLLGPLGYKRTLRAWSSKKAYFEHTTTSNLCDHAVDLLERDLSAFLSFDSVILIHALSLLLVCVIAALCSCAHLYSTPYYRFDYDHLCKA
jgi:hypothetical protein